MSLTQAANIRELYRHQNRVGKAVCEALATFLVVGECVKAAGFGAPGFKFFTLLYPPIFGLLLLLLQV